MTNATMEMLLSHPYPVSGGRRRLTANSLFALARKRARWGQFRSRLTGRSRDLYALEQLRAVCTVQARSEDGVRPVPISQIRGSEGRSRYFDRDFNPLYDRARGRWLNIATARQQGRHLPAVVLVQVGDIYFVKDGHHRISVARALGQSEIDARVTTWQVTGPLPWETSAETPSRGLMERLQGFGSASRSGTCGKLGLQGLSGGTSSSVTAA